MKKLIIILSVFCLFPVMVLGKIVTTTDCSDDDIFCGLAIDKNPLGYAETNYPTPEPFGIKLGEKLDRSIIIAEENNQWFTVYPKKPNNMFDSYSVRTEFNNVTVVIAEEYHNKEVCPLRRDFLLIKLKEKYPEAVYFDDNSFWSFVQAKKIVYSDDQVEWIEEFEISLQCSDGNLELKYYLGDGMPNYNGID